MNRRESNPLHVLLIAGAVERRRALHATIAGAIEAAVKISTVVSLEGLGDGQVAADLVVVDVEQPATASAILKTAEALPEETGVITLADNPEPRWVRKALRAGINAILERDATVDAMRLAVLACESGMVLLHPTSAGILSRPDLAPMPEASDLVEPLTAREQEILRLVSEGLGNKDIASRLKISDHTVKFHISSILGKMGVGSRTEAVSQGIRRGLVAI